MPWPQSHFSRIEQLSPLRKHRTGITSSNLLTGVCSIVTFPKNLLLSNTSFQFSESHWVVFPFQSLCLDITITYLHTHLVSSNEPHDPRFEKIHRAWQFCMTLSPFHL